MKKYVNFYVDGILLCTVIDIELVSALVKDFLNNGIAKELRIVPVPAPDGLK